MATSTEDDFHLRFRTRFKAPFIERINPFHLLPYLQCLTVVEEGIVKATESVNGPTLAADKLFDLLVRRPNWEDDLINALRNPDVSHSDLADEIDKFRQTWTNTGQTSMDGRVNRMGRDKEELTPPTDICQFEQSVIGLAGGSFKASEHGYSSVSSSVSEIDLPNSEEKDDKQWKRLGKIGSTEPERRETAVKLRVHMNTKQQDGISPTADLKHLENEVRRRLINITGISDILAFITRASDYSSEVKSIIQSICAYVESSVPGLESFWLGNRFKAASGKTEYVFVAQAQKGATEILFPTTFCSLKVIKRHASQTSLEAKIIATLEREEKLQFSDKDRWCIRQCLTRNTSKLMKEHSNLLIISASNIKSKRFGCVSATREKQTCIALYVQIKGIIPFGEKHLPTTLDGLPVDVREGTFNTYSKKPGEFHEHLIMGCKIVTAYNTCGTLGGFVQLENRKIGCLTCCHVFNSPESIEHFKKDSVGLSHVKRDVFQPLLQTDCRFGNLYKFMINAGDSANIGVDAALIEITNPGRIPIAGEFPDATSPLTG